MVSTTLRRALMIVLMNECVSIEISFIHAVTQKTSTPYIALHLSLSTTNQHAQIDRQCRETTAKLNGRCLETLACK